MEDAFSRLMDASDEVRRLSRRGLERDNITARISELQGLTGEKIREVLKVDPAEIEKLRSIVTVFSNKLFTDCVQRGDITFGMIKPHVNKAKFQAETDVEVARRIEAAIQFPLTVLASQNFFIDRAEAEILYGHLRSLGADIFERVVSFMSSGALTGLVLLDSRGNAVQAWRDQMGLTDPTQASPGTLRGDFAAGIENNVVHGSDNTESVERELKWFQEQLTRLIS